jgi:hypothetical protein
LRVLSVEGLKLKAKGAAVFRSIDQIERSADVILETKAGHSCAANRLEKDRPDSSSLGDLFFKLNL